MAIIVTLKIPDIDNVKLDEWESRRNSDTLSMNARIQPNRTMAADTYATCMEGALKTCGEAAICGPKKSVNTIHT